MVDDFAREAMREAVMELDRQMEVEEIEERAHLESTTSDK